MRVIILIFTFYFFAGNLYSKNIVLDQEQSVSINISPFLSYYVDKSGSMDLNQVRKKYQNQEFLVNNSSVAPSFWVVSSAQWGRIVIENRSTLNKKMFFRLTNPKLERIDFYQILSEDRVVKQSLSSSIPVHLRTVQVRRNVFSFDALPGENEIYYRIFNPSGDHTLGATINDEGGLFRFLSIDDLVHGAYLGIIIVMSLYNLFIFFQIFDLSYLYYFFYLISLLGGLFLSEGYLLGLGISASYFFDDFLMIFFYLSTLLWSNFFTGAFLQISQHLPSLYKIFKIIRWITFIPLFVFPISAYWGMTLFTIFLTFGILMFLFAGLLFYRKFVYARIFSHAFILHMIILLVFAMGSLGIYLPNSLFWIEGGSVIEVTMLSFALARRIRDIQAEVQTLMLIHQEIDFAAKFQKQLFPSKMPDNGQYIVSAKYLPSAKISGDFYDVGKDKNGNDIFIISDVSGHGYFAGLISSMVKIAFHETLFVSADGVEQQRHMNRILYGNVENNFVTVGNLRLNLQQGECEYTCCGHMPLILLNKETREIREFRPPGPPLGIMAAIECGKDIFSVSSNDRIILYTDGLVEESNLEGEMFGKERLYTMVKDGATLDSETFSFLMMHTLASWKRGPHREDDITYIIIDFF